MRRFRLLATSLVHARPGQVARRLALTIKRPAAQRLASVLPLARGLVAPPRPALRDDLPAPVFPPRLDRCGGDAASPTARIVGREVALTPPVDWRWPREHAGTRLDRLTLHYHEFAEGLADAAFAEVARDWIAANPPYARGYWRDAWSSYALSIRCVVWLQQLSLRRGRLDPALVAALSESIAGQIRFLARNLELDIGGNHLIRNVKALLWAARSFSGPEADAWGARGAELLARELAVQILPDGAHYERSPAYHAQVLADLIECAHVLPEGASSARLRGTLDAMAQALADLTHPDGAPALFNDGGLHMAYAPSECFRAHRAAGGAAPHPRAVAALPDAGYFVAREGDDLVVVDCGRLGPDELPAHAHGDALAFEWSLAGRRLVVDAGVYEYQGSMRPHARATASHNTVTVDDADQAEFWSSFRMARRPEVVLEEFRPAAGGFVLVGSHDGFRSLAGSPRHRRRFEAAPRAIAVEDSVTGGSGQPVRARLLLHPEVEATEVPGGLLLAVGPARARLATASPVAVTASWYCPDFGVRRRATQVVLEYGSAPCEGGFTLQALPSEA